jgi:hypothetical protein
MGFLRNLQTSKPKQKRKKFGDACFDQRVKELKAYRDTNGHCGVPARYEPNKALGWWVNKLRTQYKWRAQGKKTSLSDARIWELENLGFVWKGNASLSRDVKEGSSRDEVWKKRVQELIAYRDMNGDCRVPNMYKPNKSLGKWVNKVRTQYTGREQGKKTSVTASLTNARISELDGLGFVWKAGTKKKEGSPRDEVWKKRVQELTAFNNKYLETSPLNPLLLHKQTEERLRKQTEELLHKQKEELLRKQTEELLHKQSEELLHKQTEELLQKLLSRRRDYDLYLWALQIL